MAAGVLGTLAGLVLPEPPGNIYGDARIEGTVTAF
jgi:hypothetical protein